MSSLLVHLMTLVGVYLAISLSPLTATDIGCAPTVCPSLRGVQQDFTLTQPPTTVSDHQDLAALVSNFSVLMVKSLIQNLLYTAK